MGSGEHYDENWLNVDIGEGVRVDIAADIFDLPFPADSFDRIYLGHVLEHLQFDEISRAFTELKRVAAKGCLVGVVGPAMDLALAQNEPDWLIDAITAHGEPPGGHAWTATTALTRQAIEMSGLECTEAAIYSMAKPNWPNVNNIATWQCAFVAYWSDL